MTPSAACMKAADLNKNGKYRDDWHYYPTYHNEKSEWFVMRRLKSSVVHVAVFADGNMSGLEKY